MFLEFWIRLWLRFLTLYVSLIQFPALQTFPIQLHVPWMAPRKLNQKPLIILVWISVLDVWHCSQCAFASYQPTQLAFTCSMLPIETLEQGVKYVQWRRSDVFIVNFEHISRLVLVFLLLTLNMQLPAT